MHIIIHKGLITWHQRSSLLGCRKAPHTWHTTFCVFSYGIKQNFLLIPVCASRAPQKMINESFRLAQFMRHARWWIATFSRCPIAAAAIYDIVVGGAHTRYELWERDAIALSARKIVNRLILTGWHLNPDPAARACSLIFGAWLSLTADNPDMPPAESVCVCLLPATSIWMRQKVFWDGWNFLPRVGEFNAHCCSLMHRHAQRDARGKDNLIHTELSVCCVAVRKSETDQRASGWCAVFTWCSVRVNSENIILRWYNSSW